MELREEEVDEEECNSDLSHLLHTGQCLSHSHHVGSVLGSALARWAIEIHL